MEMREYIFRFVRRFLVVVAALWLIGFLSTPQKHKTENQAIIWKG